MSTPSADGPEIYVGLITPLGVRTDSLVDALRSVFAQYNYSIEPIRYSDSLTRLGGPVSSHPELRTRELIRRGDWVASNYGGDAVAQLGILEVRTRRGIFWKDDNLRDRHIPRRVWVFRSIKRTEELARLRQTYGRAFYALAIHASYESRLANQRDKLLVDHPSWDDDHIKDEAQNLLAIDQTEDTESGQNVRRVFPLADVILPGDQEKDLTDSADRFVRILFGENEVPTADEHAMAIAETTAALSSSLSRKVGASLTNAEGELLAVGANEVPKAGGGQYSGAIPAGRDENLGLDFNTVSLRRMVANFMLVLAADGKLNEEWTSLAEVEPDAFSDAAYQLFKSHGAEVTNLIEFQRSLHAEVAALLDAGRRGVATRNSQIYTTTYPCHLCMKEIVGAGVSRVYWIAPYEKSRAQAMFGEAIRGTIDIEAEGVAVSVVPFIGVTPRAYHRLFVTEEEYRRKTGAGDLIRLAPSSALPRVGDLSPILNVSEREQAVIEKLPREIKIPENLPAESEATDVISD